MTRISLLIIVLSLSISIYGQSPTSQTTSELKMTPFRCASKSHKKTISLNSSGDSVEGPVCAEIAINALRYGGEFRETISDTPGPNLVSIFPTSFSPGGAVPSSSPASLEEAFRAYEEELNRIEVQLVGLQDKNRLAATTIDAALGSLKDFVIQSDMIFTNRGATGVIDLVNSDAFQKALTEVIDQQTTWQTGDKMINSLRVLQAKLNALPAKYPANTAQVMADHCATANVNKLGWTDWDAKCRDAEYKKTLDRLIQLIADASQFSSDGERAATIAKKLGIAAYWGRISDSLSTDDFIRQHEISCPALFNKNRQVALKIELTDHIPTFDFQAATKSTKDNILFVQCGSRFSISAGFALSGFPNTEFAIVKGAPSPPATTSISRFGTLSNSSIHSLPIALAHARIGGTRDHKIAFHSSFGVGVNVRSQASGGSSPEFLIGPSVSFLRTIYITGGAAIGKSANLAGGFRVNDTVPSDITAPQIISSYTTRWGVAVTFTKP